VLKKKRTNQKQTKQPTPKKRLKTRSYSIVELRPPRKNGTTQRPNFSCILQHFQNVVFQLRDTTRSALWKKAPTGFKVLAPATKKRTTRSGL